MDKKQIIPISQLLDGSINTSTLAIDSKKGWQNQTQEEIIENIRQGIAELYKRGLLMDELSFHEHQLKAIQSLEDWHSGKIKPIPEFITIDSIPMNFHSHAYIGEHIPAAKGNEFDEFAKAEKFLWNGMKETIHSYVSPLIAEINTQTRIEEIEKILRKHPNRQDLRKDLIKLQKTLPKKIVKPKRKKKK